MRGLGRHFFFNDGPRPLPVIRIKPVKDVEAFTVGTANLLDGVLRKFFNHGDPFHSIGPGHPLCRGLGYPAGCPAVALTMPSAPCIGK